MVGDERRRTDRRDHKLSSLIGVTGKKRNGKDEVARFLIQHHGYQRMALADELKQMVLDLDPLVVIPDDFDVIAVDTVSPIRLSVLVERFGMEAAKNVPEVRRLLQVFGTEVMRHRDPEFWTNRLAAKIDATAAPVVVPDIRYDNEAEMIHERGGIIVKIVRPNMDDGDAHASEAGVSPSLVDVTVSNDATLAQLHAKLAQLGPMWDR